MFNHVTNEKGRSRYASAPVKSRDIPAAHIEFVPGGRSQAKSCRSIPIIFFSRRETCTWVIPSRLAVCVWVSSL